MNSSSHDRFAHLTEELERMQRELAQFRRRSRLLTGLPALLLGAWVVSAGAPAVQDDLEQRVSELEARLLKGPGTTTRIHAPFEVVGPGGNVILQVTQTMPNVSNGVGIFTEGTVGGIVVSHGGHDVAGIGTADDGEGGLLYIGDEYGVPRAEVRADGGMTVLNNGGQVVASMHAIDEAPYVGGFAIMQGKKILAVMEASETGGLVSVNNERGKPVSQMGVTDGNGYIATLDPSRRSEVELGVSDGGEPRVAVSIKGRVRASLGLRIAAGHLSLANAKDLTVANMTATGTAEGGAVIVGNGSGKGVASLTSGADGSGLVQVFQPGAGSVAVMTQDKAGGLLQIKNGSGVPVANLKAADDGGGYWQLTNPAGAPVVEGGFEGGRGIVKAGPYYTCDARLQQTVVVGVATLPDCIKGRSTQSKF